ncbi:MAG: hypothetical protein U1F83_11520 [Verrucomicrobiota bacterium]
MKITLALCFTVVGLTTYGQATKPFFTKDTWSEYIAVTRKIVQLETKYKSISIDTLEKKGLARLQNQAQKISSDEANQAELAADKYLLSKTEPLQKEIARLRLKQQELDMRYAMPAALPLTPKAAKKPNS